MAAEHPSAPPWTEALPTSELRSLGSTRSEVCTGRLDEYDKAVLLRKEYTANGHKLKTHTHTHTGETQAGYYSKRLPSLTLASSSQAHFSPTSSSPPQAAVCFCVCVCKSVFVCGILRLYLE